MFGNNNGNNYNNNGLQMQPQMMQPQNFNGGFNVNNGGMPNNNFQKQPMMQNPMMPPQNFNGGFNVNNGGMPNNFQKQPMMQNPMMPPQNNNNPNNFQQPQMIQNPMMQNQMMQNQMMQNQMMQNQMMEQQNVNNNQQNNSPQDDKALSSSIARDIINVILGSNNTSCCAFQDKLETAKMTERLNSDHSILNNYRNGLNNVLPRLLSNGASYKTMENGALRVLGGSDRVMDFMNDKIISYYAYGDNVNEGGSMVALFEGKKCYRDTFTQQDVYFDIIRCEYDLDNKTYKIIITFQDTEKEVIFEGDEAKKITGVKSGPHGFGVVVNGNNYVDMSNDVDKINQNFKDKNLKITASFVDPQQVTNDQRKNEFNASSIFDTEIKNFPSDVGMKKKGNCRNWCSSCLSCIKQCFSSKS